MYKHTRHFIILKYGGARTKGTADWARLHKLASLRAINFILLLYLHFSRREKSIVREGGSIDLNTVLMYTRRRIFFCKKTKKKKEKSGFSQ